MNTHINNKLDVLNVAIEEAKGLQQFKFSNDKRHDYDLLSWFADGGVISGHLHTKGKSPVFAVCCKKGNLEIPLGYIYDIENMKSNELNWNIPYIAYLRVQGASAVYYRNNLCIHRDDFKFSKDTASSFETNKKKFHDIVDKIYSHIAIQM